MSDKSEHDGKVVILLVQRGNGSDQPIATFVASNRTRYLVFLPKEAPVGKTVRVRLVDTGRLDKRNMSLFRAEAAEVEYGESWKDNGDGILSRVKVEIDWLFNKSVVEILETRPAGKREVKSYPIPSYVLVWEGITPDKLRLEDHPFSKVTTLVEGVEKGGQIAWGLTGEARVEQLPIQIVPIIRMQIVGGNWYENRFKPIWNPDGRIEAEIGFKTFAGTESRRFSIRLGDLPEQVRQEQEARHPLCSCGRQRRDTQVVDGYAKCELCRSEETCGRCGKQTLVKKLSGCRLVCPSCEPYEVAERLITQLSRKRREAIAAVAKKLRSGWAVAQVQGETVLRATADYLASSWKRDQIVAEWTGYSWYYFADDGVYGTKLAPAALTILELLPQATGNGLVEMVAWLSSGPKASPDSDYYSRTQVRGETVGLPLLEETVRKLAEGNLGLADRLRGSEADRIEMVRLQKELGSWPRGAEEKAVAGEFSLAIQILQSALLVKEALASLTTCPLCGAPFEDGACVKYHDHYPILESSGVDISRGETTTLARLESENGFVFAEVRVAGVSNSSRARNPGEVWVSTRGLDHPWDETTPFTKVDLIPVIKINRLSPSQAKKMVDLQKKLAGLQQDLVALERAKEFEAGVEEAALKRLEANYGTRPVADGDVFEVTFHEEERQEQQQLVAGPIFDEPSGTWIKFVLDPYQRVVPKVGNMCLVRVRAKSSQQLHLFAYRIDNPEGRQGRGGRLITVYGYFVQPAGEADYQCEITKIKAKIAEVGEEIAKVEAEPVKSSKTQTQTELADKPFDDEGNANTSMAEAMRKAGLIV